MDLELPDCPEIDTEAPVKFECNAIVQAPNIPASRLTRFNADTSSCLVNIVLAFLWELFQTPHDPTSLASLHTLIIIDWTKSGQADHI